MVGTEFYAALPIAAMQQKAMSGEMSAGDKTEPV